MLRAAVVKRRRLSSAQHHHHAAIINNHGDRVRQMRRQFWQHVFPWHAFVKWITHQGTYPLCRRQIVFLLNYSDTLDSQHDTWSKPRRIFKTLEDMRDFAIKCGALTLQIGPVWPSEIDRELAYAHRHNTPGHVAWCTELRLDIDMDDYNNVRQHVPGCNCSQAKDQGRTACRVCWDTWITQVTWPMLRYMLGPHGWAFEKWHINFSGRRGIHVWIWDARVMTWTRDMRTSFLNTLTHPSSHHLDHLVHHIYLPALGQVFLRDDVVTTFSQYLYTMCHHEMRVYNQTIPNLVWEFDNNEDSEYVYTLHDLVQHAETHLMPHHYRDWLTRITCNLMAPRFDTKVTTEPDHMCKSPLVPHPRTHTMTQPLYFIDKEKEDENSDDDILHDMGCVTWDPNDAVHMASATPALLRNWASVWTKP